MITEPYETLKTKAIISPAFKDVCRVWAKRQRARHSVTLAGLSLAMAEAGYKYPDSDYKEILSMLAALKFGILERDKNGEPFAVRQVNVQLQSLGKFVLGLSDKIIPFPFRHMYKNEVVLPRLSDPTKGEVHLLLERNGKYIKVTLPSGMSDAEIADFVRRLYK